MKRCEIWIDDLKYFNTFCLFIFTSEVMQHKCISVQYLLYLEFLLYFSQDKLSGFLQQKGCVTPFTVGGWLYGKLFSNLLLEKMHF